MTISNHNKSETNQTFLTSTSDVKPMNFSFENDPKAANKAHEKRPVIPIQNENANAWYSKFDTAWYFSTVNDNKPVVKVSEKRVIDSERSKTDEIPEPEQNESEMKNKPNIKTKSKESKQLSKRRRKKSSKEIPDESD